LSPVAVALTQPRTVALVEEPERALAEDELRVRTILSGISAGTELAAYRGTSPFLRKRWDADRRLFVPDPDRESLRYPVVAGYEEVGQVVEAGPDAAVPVGTIVYGTWGHRSHGIVTTSYARDRILPPGADPELGIFSHIGATALNGVLDSAVRLGETVAVFGLGVVGQLVAQLLRRAGATVIGVDLLPRRREVAESMGVDHVLDAGAGQVAEQIKSLTEGRGADLCVEASGSTRALHEAVRACAYSSRVVALGFYQGEAQGLFLGEELHHNRIALVCSQIGGIAPELQHRWDRARLVRTFMRLATEGAVHCSELITHRVPAADAAAIFRLLDEQPGEVLQAVLDFRAPTVPPSRGGH
jgi:2-desacetyl-2-hydroxyethyl bacteriochlorophyllide A dehydrogenase